MDENEVADRAARLEGLLDRVCATADDKLKDSVLELVAELLAIHAEAIGRILCTVTADADQKTRGQLADTLAGDPLVSHILMLHDLHPANMSERVQRALDEVQPYIASHGGSVELVSIESGVARVRLNGSCSGCPSSTATLKSTIETAIHRHAPDVVRIQSEEPATAAPRHDATIVPLAAIASVGRLRSRTAPL